MTLKLYTKAELERQDALRHRATLALDALIQGASFAVGVAVVIVGYLGLAWLVRVLTS